MKFFATLVDKGSRLLSPYQSNPNPEKHFFENYADHLAYLSKKYNHQYNQLITFISEDKYDKAARLMRDSLLHHLSLFEPLRDGYDYVDEIGAATVAPWLHLSVSLFSFAAGICKGINIASETYDKQEVKAHLIAAAFYLLLSLESFCNGMASLITRPAATLLFGTKQENNVRFIDDSVQNGILSRVDNSLF